MFKNNIKIAWRSLKKQPFFTFLNIFGLAIGMAGGLLLGLYIYDDLSHDKMFAEVDRIYRIDTDIKFGGTEIRATESAAPMAATLQRDFSQVEATVRIRHTGSALIRKRGTEANTKEPAVAYSDSTFIEFFGLNMLVGDPKMALAEPNTLVLTRTAAEKHFGIQNALGQSMLLNNMDTYTVTGVIEDLPKNSILREHSVFLSMSGYAPSLENHWGSMNFFTFVKLIPSVHSTDFKEPLQSILEKYMLPWVQESMPGITKESFEASGNYIRYHTIPLTDIHLHSSNRQAELSTNSSIQNVYILSFIGLFLIILASVNFMNLSTAHSLKRSKEVGVRKTLGSNKRDLMRQFLTESGLIAFISLFLALVLAIVVLPFFNELSGKSIVIPYTNPFFWLILVAATLVLGLLSGSYPAFFMSRFMPVHVLKGSGQKNVSGGKIRNSLVVFQFAISVFLIVSTLVVFQQLKFIQGKDLGFTKNQILLINDTYAAGNQVRAFKDEVIQMGQVESATLSGYLPTPSFRNNTSFFKEGSFEQENAIQLQNWYVDEDYIPTLGMELVAGRNFDPKFATDSTAIIINEATLPILGVGPEEALGMRFTEDLELKEKAYYTVIGVVKNFHYESLRENIDALGLFLNNSTGTMAVKLNAGDYSSAIASIESVWKKMAPGQPFSYLFMDDSFNTSYEAEQRLGEIFMVFTLLSIIIACLGLLGLATFNAQKRVKEIGVRKVLGAGVGQIVYRLSVDFLKLVGLSVIIALPLGWFAMDRWLQDFSYRIDIPWWIFALSALMAVGVALLTVSYQSIKAAIVNPVKSLRSE